MHNFFEAWKLYDVQMPKHKTLPDCQNMLELFPTSQTLFIVCN
jgi:hypothetical protein